MQSDLAIRIEIVRDRGLRMRCVKSRRAFFKGIVGPRPDHLVRRTPEWTESRRRRGWIIANNGGNIADFAAVEGVAAPSMSVWLQNHEELRRKLADSSQPAILSPHERLERLTAVRDGRARHLSDTYIAKGIGISVNRLRVWLRLWAAEGVEEAIEDEIAVIQELANG